MCIASMYVKMAHSNSILEPEVMLVFLLSLGGLNCKFACLVWDRYIINATSTKQGRDS